LWACLSKRSEFRCFTGTGRVSRVSKVGIGIRVSIRIRVSLVLVSDGLGIGLPNVERVELYVGFPACSHSWKKKLSSVMCLIACNIC